MCEPLASPCTVLSLCWTRSSGNTVFKFPSPELSSALTCAVETFSSAPSRPGGRRIPSVWQLPFLQRPSRRPPHSPQQAERRGEGPGAFECFSPPCLCHGALLRRIQLLRCKVKAALRPDAVVLSLDGYYKRRGGTGRLFPCLTCAALCACSPSGAPLVRL